jgi:hypothetical protein
MTLLRLWDEQLQLDETGDRATHVVGMDTYTCEAGTAGFCVLDELFLVGFAPWSGACRFATICRLVGSTGDISPGRRGALMTLDRRVRTSASSSSTDGDNLR